MSRSSGRTAAVKFGGSIITQRDRYCTVNHVGLDRCAAATASWVARHRTPLIIVLGGGSFGHNVVAHHGLRLDGRHARPHQAFRLTAALFELKVAFVSRLAHYGVLGMPLQESSIFQSRGARLVAPGASAIEAALKSGHVAVLSGGLVAGHDGQTYPVSSDRVFLPLCGRFGIDRVVMFTDRPGVMRGGRVVRRITRQNAERIVRFVEPPDRLDVTGGMRGKIDAALELLRHSVDTVICDGRHFDAHAIDQSLSTRPAGTLITPTAATGKRSSLGAANVHR